MSRPICAICGCGRNIENAHITAKGLGGRGSKAPADAHDTVRLCAGTGGNTDSRSCHGANHAGELALRRDDAGNLWYRPSGKTAKRLGKSEGGWHVAAYEHADPDAIDEPFASDEYEQERETWGYVLTDWARLTSMAGWKKARAIFELSRLFPSRSDLLEYVQDTLKCAMTPATITKSIAWGSLTDERAAVLGLTRGYRAGSLPPDALGSALDDAMRAAAPGDSYTWSAFDCDHLGIIPAVEKEWCECPRCSKRHTRRKQS